MSGNLARVLGWTDLPAPMDFFFEEDNLPGRFVSSYPPTSERVIYETTNAAYRAAESACYEHFSPQEWTALLNNDEEYDYIMCYIMFGEAIFYTQEADPFLVESGFLDALG